MVTAGAADVWNVWMEYQQRWLVRTSLSSFGEGICSAWASDYCAQVAPDPRDLVIVDPGNEFSYLFDLAGISR